jgi:thiol-disulfide isomerase/thioredoxin
MRPGTLVLLLAALVAAAGPPACSGEPGADAAVEGVQPEREAAPDFRLESIDGGFFTLEELRGKTLVIDFWATWCPPCEFQIPVLNEVQDSWHARDVVVLGVSVDSGGREVVEPYAESNDIRYTVLLGDEALARSFGAIGFPSTVIVDAEGRIASRHTGLVEREKLDEALAAAVPDAT